MDYYGKYLRSPIRTEIDGRKYSLLTIGHVGVALRRTPWTVRHWISVGLLPEAPFDLHPDEPRRRRRLFPQAYVLALADIAEQGYMDRRLDRDQWRRFQLDAWRAYEETVGPLTCGVADARITSASPDEGGQAHGISH